MSNKRYIEFTSAHRNRSLYPNPADFIMKISQSGARCDCATAYNPISLAYPIYNFQSPDLELDAFTFAGPCLTGGGNEKYPLLMPLANLAVPSTTYNARTALNSGFYNGMYLVDTMAGNVSSVIEKYTVTEKLNGPCLDYELKCSLKK